MKNDLLHGSPIKGIIKFALPIMASSMLQYNYNLVDNIIVGRYVGTDALAAVGSVASINSFIVGASLGLTSGFTISVAQSFGAGDKKRMNKLAGNSITLALLIGLIVVVIAHLLCFPLLRFLHTPEDIIDIAASYLNILYFAIPIQMSLNNFNALSRAVGDSKKPLNFLIVSVIINLFLDILFVAKFNWGVVGAAWATNISQLIATTCAGIDVLRFNKQFNIKKSDIVLDFKSALEQIKTGIPISMQFTITSIGSMVLQTAVNGFGSNVIAGFTAAGRVEQLLNIPMSGLGVGNMTFVSQNYGARKYNRILKAVKNVFILDIAVSVFCSAMLLIIGPTVVSLFMKEQNPEIMAAAKQYLLAIAECYSFVAILFVLRNTLQGLGFTYANAIAGAGELIGRILIALVFTRLIGFSAICYAGPMAWVLADIPLLVIYLKKKKEFKKLAISEGVS